YIASQDHRLYAFDAAGKVNCSNTKICHALWASAKLTHPFVVSAPAVANGVLFIGNNDFSFYAFDASGTKNCSGTPKICHPLWSKATGNVVVSSPAIADGRVYVGSFDTNIYAFALP